MALGAARLLPPAQLYVCVCVEWGSVTHEHEPVCNARPPSLPVQYAFVNYRRVEDAQAAFEALDGRAIPAATGKVPLKLQYRRG